MPNWNHIVRKQLATLRLPPEREIEIVEELAQCFEAVYEDALAAGLSEAEAEARAVQGYDWRLLECELSRAEQQAPAWALQPSLELIEHKGGIRMESFIQDLRFGVRRLVKNPGFTLIAVLTLALGIGANTAIFSVVNAALLRPLPFEESDRLIAVSMANPGQGKSGIPLSVADFLDWRAHNRVFVDLAAFENSWFSLTGDAEPERLRGAYVTAGFFSTLRAQPLLGRTFAAEDDAPGRPPLVLLSHRLWQRRFNSDPQLIGRAITLNGRSRAVIGVMPDGFQFPPNNENSLPDEVDLWAVHTLDPPPRRGPYYLQGIARLKPGATLEQAQAELETIGLRIRQANPLTNAETTLAGVSLKDSLVGHVRRALLVLLGAVTFVLLIASVNVANLSLARAAARQKEIAIRAALGAGSARIIRQLGAESLLLAAAGAVLGLMLAFWLNYLLITLGPGGLPSLAEVKIDYRVLGFTGAIALLSGLVFGLAPAWQGSRANLNESLNEGRQSSAEGKGWNRTRNMMVVAEVALSLALLVGAGLMLNSFVRLQRVSPGFAPANILTMEVSLPYARYKEEHQINGFYQQLLERVGGLPGVQSAGIGMSLPPNLLSITDSFTIDGEPARPSGNLPSAPLVFVSSGYFRALGVPFIAGRNFGETDKMGAPPVAIINETLARRYFPNQNPIGRRIKIGGSERPGNSWMEIVGIVGDVKYAGLRAEPEPALYQHYLQTAWSYTYLVVRSISDPRPLAVAARNAVWSLDKDLPVAGVRTMEELLTESVAQPRFHTFVFLVFGALALGLTLTGIYGVMSYLVARRMREMGIRLALGAPPRALLKLVVGQGMKLALAGVGIGLAAAFGLTRLLKGFLFGVDPLDPLTFIAVAMLLAGVALIACYIPARRAMRVDPLTAVRSE